MGPIGTNLPVWSLINVIQALFVLNSKDKNCWKRKSCFCFQREKNVRSHLAAELG